MLVGKIFEWEKILGGKNICGEKNWLENFLVENNFWWGKKFGGKKMVEKKWWEKNLVGKKIGGKIFSVGNLFG